MGLKVFKFLFIISLFQYQVGWSVGERFYPLNSNARGRIQMVFLHIVFMLCFAGKEITFTATLSCRRGGQSCEEIIVFAILLQERGTNL